MQSLYDLDAVAPMERELSNVGVTPLKTPGKLTPRWAAISPEPRCW